MAKWLVLSIMCLAGVKGSAQCDSLKLAKLENILNIADIFPTFTNIKMSFEKVGEDSLAYFYGRCPWESGGNEDTGKLLGLDKEWLARAVKAVGNYGESYDRNLGPKTSAQPLAAASINALGKPSR